MRTAKKLHPAPRVAARTAQDLPDALPSARERANVAAFDEAARSLGLGDGESRGRRWISRLGVLLRRARVHRQLGQAAMAANAAVTQPYLSRLENGLLDRRGPTVDVLLRCSEAAGCDVEITLRSRKDGRVVGRVSSSDLGRAGPPDPRDVVIPVSGGVRRGKASRETTRGQKSRS